jgi:hypothetical protein
VIAASTAVSSKRTIELNQTKQHMNIMSNILAEFIDNYSEPDKAVGLRND